MYRVYAASHDATDYRQGSLRRITHSVTECTSLAQTLNYHGSQAWVIDTSLPRSHPCRIHRHYPVRNDRFKVYRSRRDIVSHREETLDFFSSSLATSVNRMRELASQGFNSWITDELRQRQTIDFMHAARV